MRSSHRVVRPLVLTAAVAVAAMTFTPAATAAVPDAPHEGLPSGTKVQKSLVIGLDGASVSVMDKTELPAIESVRKEGMTAVSNLYANPMAPTVSGPGWSSIATGAWPDKHQVLDNSFTGNNLEQFTNFQNRLEHNDPGTSTLVAGTWGPIPDIIFKAGTDLAISGGSDNNTTAKAVDYLKNGNPDSTFVHLDDVDGAGHNSGSSSANYQAQLKVSDAKVGEILAAVKARPSYAAEDWLIVVTADHGHTPTGGHGGSTQLERQSFVIAQGAGIPANSTRNDVKVTDIAATVLKHQGVAIDPTWNLDGQPIDEIVPDAFDTLRGQLKPRADETAVGAGVLGWTHTAPEGWSIDNSAMPAGGVAEWSGWSFATDEFWTNIERNQGRETSVRNRNVFAVADSDEWDDKAHAAGKFDSTLVSPAFPLNGQPTASVNFASNYLIDGPQSAEVFISFDGGTPQLLKAYKIDTNRMESLPADVPAGAKEAQLRFKYTGTNSAFWTVDALTLTQAAWTVPVTTASIAEAPASGWHTTAPTLTLTVNGGAAALAAESGMRTEYQLNDGGWVTYSAPVTLADGETKIDYRSVNGGGVAEESKTLGTIKVDTTIPILTSKAVNRTAEAQASDAASGIAALEFSTDAGATWQPYTAAVAAGENAATVQFRAADVAGNSTTVQDVKIAAMAWPGGSATPSASATVTASAHASAGATVPAAQDPDQLAVTGASSSLTWLSAGALMLMLGGVAMRLRRRNRA
ncbi:Type I phosphodiesterase / nucleotide pyrophosphatase [Arthrobacter alpinus]|uniref:Type I phosphodiesterase / nucleotide pyrophosphatase n=1 Tax=Arthrobacter alpinus TaxID=656366 RepID=A0A1H5F9L1_9MICC|nr:alkaline phosphatase family protein [Arthrobacter alpinus]SEE00125.1 Type I phosphodiesterase / nucleotide pyrophosphatase [Arthrobacter alpinus]